MPTFKGFNTIGQHKKFSLVDYELIKRDLLNAFSIRAGEIPGLPEVGTNIWEFVFEPMDAITTGQIEAEVTRVVDADPRLSLDRLEISDNDNTVLVEMFIIITPNTDPETLYLTFNKDTETASVQ